MLTAPQSTPTLTVKKVLNILLVEDSEDDELLFRREIKRWGYTPNILRVENEYEMREALSVGSWDVIVCDYNLPQFSTLGAMNVVQSFDLDIPFIIVSGTIGEEAAVAAMKLGAHDYIMKSNLGRLIPALERELRDAEERRARREAQTLFQAILRASFHPTVIVDRVTAKIVYASDSFARRMQLESTDFQGKVLFDVVRFSHPDRIHNLLSRGQGTAWYLVYMGGTDQRVANVVCHSVDHAGKSYASIIMEDVTDQYYLKAAFDAVPNAVMIISNSDHLLYANRTAEDLFEGLVFGTDVLPVLAREELEEGWWRRATAAEGNVRVKFRGESYQASTVIFRFAGETDTSTILTLRSVTQEEELYKLAIRDELTGLYNLRYLNSMLPQQIAAVAEGKTSAYAALDLDFFKPINDELGHAAGDAALVYFANCVRSEIRGGDIFARTGGDEFAILFPDNDIEAAAAAIARVYARLEREPFEYDKARPRVSFSSGVVGMRAGETMEELKERADRCVYAAKERGRGCCIVEQE